MVIYCCEYLMTIPACQLDCCASSCGRVCPVMTLWSPASLWRSALQIGRHDYSPPTPTSPAGRWPPLTEVLGGWQGGLSAGKHADHCGWGWTQACVLQCSPRSSAAFAAAAGLASGEFCHHPGGAWPRSRSLAAYLDCRRRPPNEPHQLTAGPGRRRSLWNLWARKYNDHRNIHLKHFFFEIIIFLL